MKLLVELLKIFLISLAGEVLSDLIPLAIPSSILSLFLLLILLFSRIIKTEDLEISSNWILSNMAIFFIPSCVGVIEHLELLLSSWWQILVISTLSFFLTFIASGYTVMFVQRLCAKKGGRNE